MREVRFPVPLPLVAVAVAPEPRVSPMEYYVLEFDDSAMLVRHPTNGRVVVRALYDAHTASAHAWLRGLID